MRFVHMLNTTSGHSFFLPSSVVPFAVSRPAMDSSGFDSGHGYTQLKCPHGEPVFANSPSDEGHESKAFREHIGNPHSHTFAQILAVAILESDLLSALREARLFSGHDVPRQAQDESRPAFG